MASRAVQLLPCIPLPFVFSGYRAKEQARKPACSVDGILVLKPSNQCQILASGCFGGITWRAFACTNMQLSEIKVSVTVLDKINEGSHDREDHETSMIASDCLCMSHLISFPKEHSVRGFSRHISQTRILIYWPVSSNPESMRQIASKGNLSFCVSWHFTDSHVSHEISQESQGAV